MNRKIGQRFRRVGICLRRHGYRICVAFFVTRPVASRYLRPDQIRGSWIATAERLRDCSFVSLFLSLFEVTPLCRPTKHVDCRAIRLKAIGFWLGRVSSSRGGGYRPPRFVVTSNSLGHRAIELGLFVTRNYRKKISALGDYQATAITWLNRRGVCFSEKGGWRLTRWDSHRTENISQ